MWSGRGSILRQNAQTAGMGIHIHGRGLFISAIMDSPGRCSRSKKLNRLMEIGVKNGWKMRHRSENTRIGRLSRLTGKVIVTAQKESGDGEKGNVIEDMDDALKKLGLTRENAKFLLKAWKEAVRLCAEIDKPMPIHMDKALS